MPTLLSSLHAAEHSMIALLPLWAMCDRWDIGGLSTNIHQDTGAPTVFIYDGHPGGVGIAERGFDQFEGWVADTVPHARGLPLRARLPVVRPEPEVRQPQRVARQGRRADAARSACRNRASPFVVESNPTRGGRTCSTCCCSTTIRPTGRTSARSEMATVYEEYMRGHATSRDEAQRRQLQPAPRRRRRVRVKDGETLVTDGPFAETKETLGGYYLVEADSIDEALEARRADPVRARSAARSRSARSWRCSDAVHAAHLRRRGGLGRATRRRARGALRGVRRARATTCARRASSLAGEELQPVATATTVQVRNGETLVTDGPFAETKEALGGFYLIEAESLDEAIEWAARIPSARDGHDRDPAGRRPLGDRRIDDLARAYRDERARCIAILGRVLGDLDLAEDAVQDAFVMAAERWPRDGTPANPGAWIVATARNRAIDRIRREQTLARKTELLARARAAARRRGGRDSRRAARADLRLLPPGARRRRAGRADAEPRRRPDDAGDRARVPRPRADARAAARAREAEDPRRRHPAPRAAGAPPAGAAAHGARGDLPRLQRGLRAAGAAGALRRGDPARAAARDADAGRGRGARPPRALLLQDARRDARVSPTAGSCCSTTRTARSGTRPRSRRAAPRSSARSRCGCPARTSCRRRSPPLHAEAETRLAADRAPLRPPRASSTPSPVVELNRAVAVAMADGPEEGLALDRRDRAASTTTTSARGAGRPAAPARTHRRGARRVRARARARAERGRARLPAGAPARYAERRVARCVEAQRRHARSSAAASPAPTSRACSASAARRSSATRTSCSTRRSCPRRRPGRSSRAHASCRCASCARTPSCCSATLTAVDLEARDGDGRDRRRRRRPSRWSELVLALGAVPRVAPDPGPRRARALVQVARRRDPPAQPRAARARGRGRGDRRRGARRAQLTFVFVGAGYAGVEALAELSDLVDDALRYYPRLRDVPRALGARRRGAEDPAGDPAAARRVRGARARASAASRSTSARRSSRSTADEAVLGDGTRIPTHTLVWTAGVRAEPAAARARAAARRARPRRGRRVPARARRTSTSGRSATARACRTRAAPTPDPPTCQHALRQARRLAKNLAAATRSRTATGCSARSRRSAATRASPTCSACASAASPAGSSRGSYHLYQLPLALAEAPRRRRLDGRRCSSGATSPSSGRSGIPKGLAADGPSASALQRLVDALPRRQHAREEVAVLADALEHDVHRERRRIERSRSPRPSEAASTPARPAAAAPSTPTRSSCPRRSGSSRSARRAASPSTTRSSRARDACARSRRRRSPRTRACRRTCSGARPARARACRPRSTSSRTTTSPSASSACLDEQRDLHRLLEADVGRRIEVEEHEVGAVGLVDARVPRVHVDAAHVHHPEQRVLVVHDRRLDPLLASRGDSRVETCTRNARDPLRHVRRRVLLEERLAVRAVGIAAHRERPVAQVRHEHRRDRAVVVDQVALRDPLVGPEDLVEVRELDAALGSARPGSSRCTSRAGLSSRSPWNDGARRCPSCVHSANSTSQTSFGSTHTTSPLRTFGIFGTTANGDVVASQRLELREQLVDRRAR